MTSDLQRHRPGVCSERRQPGETGVAESIGRDWTEWRCRFRCPGAPGTVPVEIDEARVAGVLGANVERAEDPEGVLRAALEAPGAGLKAFLRGAASPLLVVVNDATRPTPSAEVLRVIRADLEEWLAGDEGPHGRGRELSLVVATGTHRVALPQELEHIFGKEFLAGPRRAHLVARRQGQVATGPPGPDRREASTSR